MNPAVSLIIPVYKVEKYISDCIKSVIGQTCRDFELILVDDCSPDRSMEIARDVADKAGDISVSYLRTPVNSGISVARNMGIKAARGEYLLFVDSDDRLTEDCLDVLLGMSKKYPEADFILGNFFYAGKIEKQDALGFRLHNLPEYVGGGRIKKAPVKEQFPAPYILEPAVKAQLADRTRIVFPRRHSSRRHTSDFLSCKAYISLCYMRKGDVLLQHQGLQHNDDRQSSEMSINGLDHSRPFPPHRQKEYIGSDRVCISCRTFDICQSAAGRQTAAEPCGTLL